MADRPALELALEPLLETDEAHHKDVRRYRPRGAFGELVPEGVVEGVETEYWLANPEAVGRALAVEGHSDEFACARRARVDADGRYRLRVASPGEYERRHPDGNTTTTVAVSGSAVGNGERVDAGALGGGQSATVTGGPGCDLTRSAPRRSVPRAAR